MLSYVQQQQQHDGKTASLRQKLQILGFQADEELLELLTSLPQFEDQLCLEDYILPETFALMESNSISLNCLNDLQHQHHPRELLSLPSVQIQQRCLGIQAEINAFERENSLLFPEISKLSQTEQEYSVEFQSLLHEFKEKGTNLVNALTVLQNSVTSFREFQAQNAGFSNENVHDFLSSAAEECDSLAEKERKFLQQTLQEINDSIHLFESEISLLAQAKLGNQCSFLGQAERESEEGGEILKNGFFELNNCIFTWNLWMKNVNSMFLVACQAAFSQQQQWKEEKTNLQNLALDFSQKISQQLSELINSFSTEKNENHAASSSSSREIQQFSPNFNSLFVEPASKLMHLIQESFPCVMNAIPKTSCIANLDSQLQPEINAIFLKAHSLNERIRAIEMESTE